MEGSIFTTFCLYFDSLKTALKTTLLQTGVKLMVGSTVFSLRFACNLKLSKQL